jgi:hypothetical protein
VPIARVRPTWGVLAGGKRRLTLTVVDRLGKRYAPAEFADNAGGRAGRWLLVWYASGTEHGAAASVTVDAAVLGRTVGAVGPLNQVLTDARGQWAADVEVSGAATVFVMAGVLGLVQSRPGLVWASAPAESAE